MTDKVVVITGASSGIGAAHAERLGKAGARPVLVARREKELKQVAGRTGGLPVVADVTRRADHERVLRTAVDKLGHVDVWVNNAGRGISRSVEHLTDGDLDEMMLVNLKSVLYGMQAVLPHFKARRRGQIINVSSLLGRMPTASFRSAYSAAKAAMNSLTANLRMDLRAEFPDIHVTLFSPGVVATDFGSSALGGGIDSRKIPGAQPVEEVAEAIAQVIERPVADAYSRPAYRQTIAGYYSAEDMAAVEAQWLAAFQPPRK